MLKRAKLLMVIGLFVSMSAQAEKVVAPNADIVKESITEFMQANNIPGVAVEIYVDGKPYSYYFGQANPTKKIPITKNTIFEIGSLSKVMTSILFAQQIDAAKMQFDDSITKYMKDLSNGYEDITVKNLATNTSGLPFKPPVTMTNQAQLDNYLKTWKPDTAPDEQWIYSNFGYGMLALTLEAATHKNIAQLYTNQIAKPLHMQPIVFDVPRKLKQYVAQGYDKDGKAVPLEKITILAAAGDMKASANDMQHFLSAAIGLQGTPERILYPMRMTQAAYVKLPDAMQGLGWLIHPITPDNVNELLNDAETMNKGPIAVEEMIEKPKFDGDALIDKTGGTSGFRTYVALIPNKKTGIVILTNKFVSNGAIVNTGRNILFKLNHIEQQETAQVGTEDSL